MNKNPKKGFTLVETLVGVSIMAIVAFSIYGAFTKIFYYIADLRAKSASITIINEQIEIIRNLPYTSVGIVSGIPNGILPREKTIVRAGKTFNITTTIRNIDDPFDGVLGGTPNDTSPADGKLVEIEIDCDNCKDFTPTSYVARVSPKNLETASNNGALFVRVFDANGVAIEGADVHVVNPLATTTITIDDVTNNTGYLQIVDAPPAVAAYQITVTKPGYSTDRTYATSSSNPSPLIPHATVINQQVTQVSLAIDRLSTLNISSKNESCAPVGAVNFSLNGSKKIGQTPDVYKTENSYVTNSLGIKTLSSVEWDTYTLTPSTAVYDLVGTNPISPINVLPGEELPVDIVVAPKRPNALLVSVRNSIGLPISGVKVTLEKSGDDIVRTTSEGSVTQTNWSEGSGQTDWPGLAGSGVGDESSFLSTDGNIETNSPVGDLKLKDVFGTYSSSGTLTSSTFDVGTTSSYAFIRSLPTDQPVQTGVNSVKFQVASNSTNTASTTWNFVGPDGTASTFYTTTDQSLALAHSGNRYLRYKLFMSTLDSAYTPLVSDISLTFISSCIPPGQVSFSNLDFGIYNITVEKTGLITYTGIVDINGAFQSSEVVLTE